ncbi:DNA replication and repair protein RecF [candidate division WOR-3 bacterium]|nr:DNA replication and repair protein RecF [candidate division WOR-3 bacterium]
MFIKHLHLKNFRNYENASIDLDRGINLFFGENGSGKTNLLDATHYISYGKSVRNSPEDELVRFSSTGFAVSVVFEKKGEDCTLSVKYSDRKKEFWKNEMKLEKKSDLIGELTVIPFSPEDADVISQGSAQRRRALDILLSSVDGEYLKSLRWYNKTLRQRNALLERIRNKESLETETVHWDKMLSLYGEYIVHERGKMIEILRDNISRLAAEMETPFENFDMEYRPSLKRGEIAEKMSANLGRDLKSLTTTQGPHRDDFVFYINGQDASKFASRGQQRLLCFMFRLAEVDIYRDNAGEYPVIVIDEAFIELDKSTVLKLEDKLTSYPQVLLASADGNVISEKIVSAFFNVSGGYVEKNKKNK